jgi:cellulose synthase/poly-beta-1,6-N-acetylglucosamine synthase-like glycosyltransferase
MAFTFDGTALFWASVVLLVYTHFGYPALVWIWAWLRPRPPRALGWEPEVSVVVVVQDEAPRIEARIENLLAMDYPKDRLTILIASDGSTDGTAERARAYEQENVRVFAFSEPRGKPAALNDVVRAARGEVLVLADARQRFERGALRALVAPFADPEVGVVSGELMLDSGLDGSAVGEGVRIYWGYEKFLRRCESRIDSIVGATGAIYAIRRALFEPLPRNTLLDDVLIVVRTVRHGYRAIFEPKARAHDRPSTTAEEEFQSKVRTIAGNFQLFSGERWLLNPLRNRLWIQTVSHRGLRLLCPLFLLCALSANVCMVDSPLYAGALAGQVVFYSAALAGRALRHQGKKTRLLTLAYVFCLLHWATVVAFFRFVTGQVAVTWKLTPAGRSAPRRKASVRP